MNFKTLAVLLPLACLATVGSCAIQRNGPEQAVYCDRDAPLAAAASSCIRPVLNAGWPVPFLVDRPGISLEGVIGFPEDDFRLWPFIANVLFYQLVLLGLWKLVQHWRRSGG